MQHQRDLRNQHLQRFQVCRSIDFMTLSGAQHQRSHRTCANPQRGEAFDGVEERSLARAKEFLDVLLAVR